VFLTGATGLVGSYLLKILLQKGHKVYALSRSKDDKNARQRVVDILNYWDKKVYPKFRWNLMVLEGDITQSNLGLSQKKRNLVKNNVEEFFHSAAVTDINWPLNKIRKINVGGTKNVLDFAIKCKKIYKVNHISTAYVCGKYKGVFTENDLDVGQSFNTTYEQSKFEAEKLVKKYRKKLKIDIFRPSVVIGESKTGKINQLKNIYQFLKLCELELFDSLPILKSHISTVFIDDCARALYAISKKSNIHNKTYNIFPNTSVPLKRILNIFCDIRKLKRPRIISISAFNLNRISPSQKIILKRNILALNTKVKLDSRNTSSILRSFNFEYTLPNKTLLKRILAITNRELIKWTF
jgi:thioester reductase-like protein